MLQIEKLLKRKIVRCTVISDNRALRNHLIMSQYDLDTK
jgi:hypothetical protein